MKTLKLVVTFVTLLIPFLTTAQTAWYQITSGTQKKLNTINFPSASVGYIGGNDSLLLKTTNGGFSWTPLNYSGVTFFPGGEHILNLQFLRDDVGYMTVGPYSGTYKTIDGGNNWIQLPMPLNQCYNQGLYFFNQNDGFIGGSGCFQGEIIGRINGGAWASTTLNAATLLPANLIVDFDFYNSSLGLAASRSGYIFRTTDGGVNWDSIPTSTEYNPLTSVVMINDTLAYAGYESPSATGFGLYISTDGGLTWNFDINSATFFYPDFMCLHHAASGQLYTGGISLNSTTGVIFESPADITTWTYTPVDQKINDISSHSDSTVFGVGDSGYIVVNKILTGLEESSTQQNLMLLFPNPANDVVKISVSANFKTASATINLYNTIGQRLYSLPFKNTINVSALCNGIYLLEINDNVQTFRKKIMIE
ncbi:MAG TPA: T9SS type A sorting domain-containing protein [Bacteroidia bacterium]|nr:T9SS type A sorting domain-containing protein [Bacteroidia bacterium]HNU32468.1 T9SS type A sorting domain-containing protein [Bacteroidia bacterium]